MALKDFKWFDRRGSLNYNPNSLEDYVAGGAMTPTGYTPSSQGALSILGQTLSGVGAAFAGDGQYMQRQQKINQEQMQSDLEFQALLAKNATDKQRYTNTYSFNPLTGEYEFSGEVPKGSIVRNQNPIDQQVELQKAKDLAKGIPAADFGRVALAKESLGNLEDVDKILFPKGTTESFKRDIAGASNLPLIGGPAPFNKDAQRVYRKLGSSLAARQLIQTGVAANESERKNLANQFLANYGSDPTAFREGIGQLKSFYNEYQDMYKTKGISKDTGSKVSSEGWNQSKQARLEELRKKLGK